MSWFSLNTGGNPIVPSDYTLQGSEPSCSGTQQICAIQAADDGNNKPVLSNTLKNEMINTLNNRLSSTNVKLVGFPS